MKITYKGDYALKAILDLAINDGEIVTIHELARRADIPIKFLEQVLLELKKGGFVASKRGKQGGYRLAQKPSHIKVGDVVRFIEGPIEPIACLEDGYRGCNDVYRCIFRKIWKDVAHVTAGVIDKVNFETLATEAKGRTNTLSYQI
ncbi:MAG: Rrf2 family transcriptional regulator [Candidatus Omnitrophota bacterium]